MPEETTFFSYIVARLFEVAPALKHNLAGLNLVIGGFTAGKPMQTGPEGALHTGEALFTSIFIVLLVIVLALFVRGKVKNHDDAVIPDAKLSLRTFFELLIGYFYDSMKEMMGPKRAKRYFPLIGTCACFIFFSNFLGLIPGLKPPTSTWNITWGCALVVFLAFNYYGLKENGLHYIKHFAGPVWWLAWLIFPLELISMLIRPATLSIRLMLNMAVDHLLLAMVTGLIAILVPLPLMVLGTLVALIQVIVFCLLSSIYITLATEDMKHHGDDHGSHGEAAAAH
jgi:F-type H+-transporting ATPase subunit a